MTPTNILVINCGSSSIKFAIINPSSQEEIFTGLAERLHDAGAQIVWKEGGEKKTLSLPNADHDGAGTAIINLLAEKQLSESIYAIGHRVVHGAERFSASTLINDEVMQTISECQTLAPLHNPANLVGIKMTQKNFPSLPHVAVFDTAFHQTMPKHAYLYAVPYELYKEHGVRRYGFHGTSYRYVCAQAAKQLELDYDNSALLCAHLGNGCSAAAVLNGQCVDTTMGLTPLEGLVMGTRSGNVDPNLFSFLSEQCGYSLQKTTDMLNKRSGLVGISELSNDMRTLESAAAEGHEQAQLALDVFVYTLSKQLAGLAIGLGRIDALIFTGGIGENSDLIRRRVLEQLAIFGFDIDAAANDCNGKNSAGIITTGTGPKAVVVNTNEELMIALDTQSLALKDCK